MLIQIHNLENHMESLHSLTLPENSDFAVCHHKTLDKGFAECNTRQTAHGIYNAGKRLFTECFLSDTQQIFCRELKPTFGKKK